MNEKNKRRIIYALTLTACLGAGTLCLRQPEKEQPEKTEKTLEPSKKHETGYIEEKITLVGEWGYDIDSMGLARELRDYDFFIKKLGINSPIDHKKLRYGADSRECDVILKQPNLRNRRLVPGNGAEIVLLGKVDFDKVTLEDLMSATYSTEPIKSNDQNDPLVPGAVIAIKTNQGKYTKLKIDGYIPMKRSLKGRDLILEFEKFNFACTLGIYSPEDNKNPKL